MENLLKWWIFIFIMSWALGCTRMSTLNRSEHYYGALPTRIVWIQVAGLQDEHLAMLRFFRPTVQDESAFEKMSCLGKTWSYNLFQIRPPAYSGLLSQITGKKNISNSCRDYSQAPVWKYMIDNGYQSAIFESATTQEIGLTKALLCEGAGKDYFKDVILWVMRPGEEKNEKDKKEHFHVQDQGPFQPGHVYYDRSCQKDGCYTGLSRNIEYVFKNFHKNKSQYFFLIRDFSFHKALQNKEMDKVKEILLDIERIYAYFAEHLENDREMLLLLSSTSPLNIEYPDEGKDWATFEESGGPVLYKRTSLLAPVFAKGARSENFCGIYEEAEILTRITSGPPKVGH